MSDLGFHVYFQNKLKLHQHSKVSDAMMAPLTDLVTLQIYILVSIYLYQYSRVKIVWFKFLARIKRTTNRSFITDGVNKRSQIY